MNSEILTHFWGKVALKQFGCWKWLGLKTKGYGSTNANGKSVWEQGEGVHEGAGGWASGSCMRESPGVLMFRFEVTEVYP
jgi:hypothetical protein